MSDKSGKDSNSALYVPYEHFRDFTSEFRLHAQKVETALQSMSERLSDGSQRFVRQEGEVNTLKARTAEHSDLVKQLMAEKLHREAIAQHLKPRKSIIEGIIGSISTAVVLGALLIAFNMYRDWDRAKHEPVKEPPRPSSTSISPAAAPGP